MTDIKSVRICNCALFTSILAQTTSAHKLPLFPKIQMYTFSYFRGTQGFSCNDRNSNSFVDLFFGAKYGQELLVGNYTHKKEINE